MAVYIIGLLFADMICEDLPSEHNNFRVVGWPLWLVIVLPIYLVKQASKAFKVSWNIKWLKLFCSALMNDIRKAWNDSH